MTINEIKGLTKFLSEEEVEKIKQQIKDKEQVLKSGDLEEEELVQVLNTLFAILVIEKALESEIEGIEEIKDELQEELTECYNTYDSYIEKSKREDKKKKKRWLLDLLCLSDHIHDKKQTLGSTNKNLARMENELKRLKQQRSEDNLRKIVNDKQGSLREKFCDTPHKCKHPQHNHGDGFIQNRMNERNERRLQHALIRAAVRQAAREQRTREKTVVVTVKQSLETVEKIPDTKKFTTRR